MNKHVVISFLFLFFTGVSLVLNLQFHLISKQEKEAFITRSWQTVRWKVNEAVSSPFLTKLKRVTTTNNNLFMFDTSATDRAYSSYSNNVTLK